MNRLISVIGRNKNTEQEANFSEADKKKHLRENRKYIGSAEFLEILGFFRLVRGFNVLWDLFSKIFSTSVSNSPKNLILRISISVVS